MIELIEKVIDRILTLLGAFLLYLKSFNDGQATERAKTIEKGAQAVIEAYEKKDTLEKQNKGLNREDLARATVEET